MDKHQEVLRDIKRRLTSTVLLFGELNEEEGLKAATRQGEWERWASDYLAKMKEAEKEVKAVLAGRFTIVRHFLTFVSNTSQLRLETRAQPLVQDWRQPWAALWV